MCRAFPVVCVAACLLGQISLRTAAAHEAINGGPAVASTSQAPWSVVIDARSVSGAGYECSGSIIDATHVLTAAHCTFDPQERRFPLPSFIVRAGIVEGGSSGDLSQLQVVDVAGIAIHPGFQTATNGDDVALLTVTPSFVFGGSAVAPISTSHSHPPPGSPVTVYGWGQRVSGLVDKHEHSLKQTLVGPYVCTSGVPSYACGSSRSGATCEGDSGAGLVWYNPQPQLVGVDVNGFDQVGRFCFPGDSTGYVDVTSPEVRGWLATGSAPTLRAPRTDQFAVLTGSPYVGGLLTCAPPRWTGEPKVSFEFVRMRDYAVLQATTSPRFAPQAALVGEAIGCVSVAANAGGTTFARSANSPVIRSKIKPRLLLELADGAIRISDRANLNYRTHLLFYRDHKTVRGFFFRLSKSFVVASPQPGYYTVCVSVPARSYFTTGRMCIRWESRPSVPSLARQGVPFTRAPPDAESALAP